MGAFKRGRMIDTLVMNSTQHYALHKLLAEGKTVYLFMYYYPDNVLLILDLRGTTVVKNTAEADQENVAGEKIFYEFDASAVIARFDGLTDATFRSSLRDLQYNRLELHTRHCSEDECRLQRLR